MTALGSPPSQLYSIYVGSNPTTEPLSPATTSDPGIAITGANDLSAFTNGLSIVSNQTLYLLDVFNQGATKICDEYFRARRSVRHLWYYSRLDDYRWTGLG